MIDFSFAGFPDHVLTEDTVNYPFTSAVVFGCGGRGASAIEALATRNIKVEAVIDNDIKNHGTQIFSIDIVSPEKLNEYKCPILIASYCENEIYSQLEPNDFQEVYFYRARNAFLQEQAEAISANIARLNAVYKRLADDESRSLLCQALKMRTFKHDGRVRMSEFDQYDHPDVSVRPGDVILDVGGMFGETSIYFANRVGMNCKAYTFEPSPSHLSIIHNEVKNYPGVIEVVEMGAWSHATTLKFDADFPNSNPGGHCISQDGEDEIDVIDIDTFVKERKCCVNLIKMDIEGAEMEALYGARKTIVRCLPKLQISIYHKVSHLWEVFEYINSIDKNYVYYIGHHSRMPTETVLYARQL